MILKPIFMLIYSDLMGQGITISDYIDVMRNGFSMDLSMAAYLTILPAILNILHIWIAPRWLPIAEKTYLAITAIAIAIIACLDMALYGYWGFRIDMTPIFYFTSSPASALASAEWWQLLAAIVIAAVASALIYLALRFAATRVEVKAIKSIPATIATLLLLAAMFIPLRGGVTVSTMNLSRAYFSPNQRLNHAAINPVFSLMYSALHNDDFASKYQYMDATEASRLFDELNATVHNDSTAVATPLLKCDRPDIYLIILESFSSHLMPSLGGESIAVGLDSLANEGILFTNFYANSIRTDRALPSILSGFPAQPSTSIMKHVDKTDAMPSIPSELKKAGYKLTYYYGGDANFTNMQAFLVNSGFENIVSDKDFAISDRTGKWGAPDHLVFERALADAAAVDESAQPLFNVIQTSSSHEPFEVPYSNPKFADTPSKNAFAYTDSCTFAFIDAMRSMPRADRTLFILVPDHQGAYPRNIESAVERHRIPLILFGQAIAQPRQRIDVVGSQNNIAATLLGMLGIDHSMFKFSKDMLNDTTGHFAVFTEPSLIGIVTPADTTVYNCESDTPVLESGNASKRLTEQAKAYLQNLYTTISNL